MDDLIQDLRYAVRSLVHDIGFAATVVTVLAVGVAAREPEWPLFRIVDGHSR